MEGWTTLAAVDRGDIFDSGKGTTQYIVLGQIGKEGDEGEEIFTEVTRKDAINGVLPKAYLVKSGNVQVRYVGRAEETLQEG